MLMFFLASASLAAVYWFWVRPILKSRPELRELYEHEENFLVALREKLKGIKQKLSSVVVITASAVVSAHDFFVPIVSGVDVSSLTARVPSWAWPLLLIGLTALFQFLRNLADKRYALGQGDGDSGGSA